MGIAEIGVIAFLVMLVCIGYFNSRKVSQELKKMGIDK